MKNEENTICESCKKETLEFLTVEQWEKVCPSCGQYTLSQKVDADYQKIVDEEIKYFGR